VASKLNGIARVAGKRSSTKRMNTAATGVMAVKNCRLVIPHSLFLILVLILILILMLILSRSDKFRFPGRISGYCIPMHQRDPNETMLNTFPNGASKALIFSYDDGLEQDIRLVRLLDNHGIKATFNLNSGRLGQKALWLKDLTGLAGRYLTAQEAREVYQNHEIAAHSVNHPVLTDLEDETLGREIAADVAALQFLSPYPVTSFAYPFGRYDTRVIQALRQAGINNARTGQDTGEFALPADPLVWHPTTHHSNAQAIIDRFLHSDTGHSEVCLIWGHSWEFDRDEPHNNWRYLERLLNRLAGHKDIWYTGAGEFVRHCLATKS
jgi:peptidoglycan/xylan/chitin deacetylase (PgdA/CDA1 family)